MSIPTNIAQKNLQEALTLLTQFLGDEKSLKNIASAVTLMLKSIQLGGKIISCGNGGSMCDAMHFAEELSGRFRENRRGLPAVAISDSSYLTCVGNDYGFEHIFSRYLEAMGKKEDTLLCISTSGNSANIIQAAIKAKEMGIYVVGLTGKDGGKLKKYCDIEIRSPKSEYADRAQEIHIKIIHIFIESIEKALFS